MMFSKGNLPFWQIYMQMYDIMLTNLSPNMAKAHVGKYTMHGAFCCCKGNTDNVFLNALDNAYFVVIVQSHAKSTL